MTCDMCKETKNPLFGITRDEKDYFICNDCWPKRDEIKHIEYDPELTLADWILMTRSFLKHHKVFHPECNEIHMIRKWDQ